MRILINGLPVQRGGHKTYYSNLLPRLGRIGEDHQFFLLQAPDQSALDFDLPGNFTRIASGPKSKSMPMRVAWEQLFLPSLLARERIDVMFAPTPATAFFTPCPIVIAVRNPNIFATLGIKDWRYQLRNSILRTVTRIMVKRAAHVIFVSSFSYETAARVINIDPSKVRVIYHGTGEHFFQSPKTPLPALEMVKRPFILTVSTIQPHKNYLLGLDAFGQLSRDLGYDYVIAGSAGSKDEFRKLEERMLQSDLTGRTHYIGEIEYQDLPALYQNAALYFLPSRLETFGHTLVEAMASGLPIAASNAAAIPEICGQAAIFFDPENVLDMISTLKRGLLDTELRETLAKAGRERVKDFSWDESAKRLLSLFESIPAT